MWWSELLGLTIKKGARKKTSCKQLREEKKNTKTHKTQFASISLSSSSLSSCHFFFYCCCCCCCQEFFSCSSSEEEDLQNSELGFNSALPQKSKYYALRSLGETVQSSRGRRPQSKDALISRRNIQSWRGRRPYSKDAVISRPPRERERERKLERKRIIVLN